MGDVGDFFTLFLKHGMKEDKAYDLLYFSKTYNMKQNISQYYLRKLTYDKLICCVKVRNKTYYMARKWYNHFKIFEMLDYVKVI
jgi:hypothetical protein